MIQYHNCDVDDETQAVEMGYEEFQMKCGVQVMQLYEEQNFWRAYTYGSRASKSSMALHEDGPDSNLKYSLRRCKEYCQNFFFQFDFIPAGEAEIDYMKNWIKHRMSN